MSERYVWLAHDRYELVWDDRKKTEEDQSEAVA
jgi:hypothetical protein